MFTCGYLYIGLKYLTVDVIMQIDHEIFTQIVHKTKKLEGKETSDFYRFIRTISQDGSLGSAASCHE